jgi:hypothetical protein
MSTANTPFYRPGSEKVSTDTNEQLLTRLTGTPDKTKGQNQIDLRRSRQRDGPAKYKIAVDRHDQRRLIFCATA